MTRLPSDDWTKNKSDFSSNNFGALIWHYFELPQEPKLSYINSTQTSLNTDPSCNSHHKLIILSSGARLFILSTHWWILHTSYDGCSTSKDSLNACLSKFTFNASDGLVVASWGVDRLR